MPRITRIFFSVCYKLLLFPRVENTQMLNYDFRQAAGPHPLHLIHGYSNSCKVPSILESEKVRYHGELKRELTP